MYSNVKFLIKTQLSAKLHCIDIAVVAIAIAVGAVIAIAADPKLIS